jgi:hypothetical protein
VRRAGAYRGLVALAAAVLCAACGASNGTQRIFDGRLVSGPYIEPEAYAAYIEGAYREARGEWDAAERAYRRALSSAPSSAGIRLRLGAIACRSDLKRGLDILEGLGDESDDPQVWLERARCHARHGDQLSARREAEHAVQIDPRDAGANLLVSASYLAASEPARARQWLLAWLLLEPELGSFGTELLTQTDALGDEVLGALARRALRRSPIASDGGAPLPSPPQSGTGATAPGSDRVPAEAISALRAGDLSAARDVAAQRNASSLDVARWALQAGQPGLAEDQAQTLLEADPNDSDALVMALVAAHTSGDEALFRQLLRRARASTLAPAAVPLLAELLRVRIGTEAASSFRAALSQRGLRGPD